MSTLRVGQFVVAAILVALGFSGPLDGQENRPATGGNPAKKNPASSTPAKSGRGVGGDPGRPNEKAVPANNAGKKEGKTAPANAEVEAKGTQFRPAQPKWFPLDSETQNYVNEVLEIWEKKSSSVVRFRCNFIRYNYASAFGPYLNSPDGKELRPATRDQGVIVYRAPNMGMIRVDKTERNTMKARDRDDVWSPVSDLGDYWMCDGKSLFYLNHEDKTLVKRTLPLQMQGREIVNGPLPFIFGAKAGDIRERFWVRPRKADAENEVILEFIPKKADDAADFKLAWVILEEDKNRDVLPKAVRLVHPGGEDEANYVLVDREYNWNLAVDKVKHLFDKAFDSPFLPKSYKLVSGDPIPTPKATPQAGRPGNTKSR